jgi:Uncharacterized conserved protein
MNNAVNILIIGANFTNKGAEAMLKVVQHQLRLRYGQVTCYMVCRKYERELAISQGFEPVYSDEAAISRFVSGVIYGIKGKIYKLLTKKNMPWYFPFPFGEISRIIGKLDAIIDVSGFAYADSWGKPMIDETIRLQRMARSRGVKCYFMPQAWGPFEKPEVAKAARTMLNLSDGFYARDTVSRRYLAKLLQLNPEAIPMLPDIVFSAADDKTNTISAEDTLRIGISPNLRVYEKLEGAGTDNQYVRVLLSLCRYCLDVLGAEIVLIPNEIFPDGVDHPDDRTLCRLIYESLNRPEGCMLLDGYASAEAIRSQIQHMDYLISSRFHALIFGFLERKPVLAISWSHKYRELFGLFGLESYVLESGELTEETVIAKLNQLMAERTEVVTRINGRLAGLKQRIDILFDGLTIRQGTNMHLNDTTREV